MLFQCFQSLKLYGKEPEAIESTVAMFQLVLADYEPSDIRKAFAVYLKRHTEMPAPADIASLIDRDGKPPLDRAVYVTISKKLAEDRTSTEWAYMRDYEKFAVNG